MITEKQNMWLITRNRTPLDVVLDNGKLCIEMSNQLIPLPQDKDINLIISKVRGKRGYIMDKRYWNDKA